MPCYMRPNSRCYVLWFGTSSFVFFLLFFSWWWWRQKSSFYCCICLHPPRYIHYKGVIKINTRPIQIFIYSLVAIADGLTIQNVVGVQHNTVLVPVQRVSFIIIYCIVVVSACTIGNLLSNWNWNTNCIVYKMTQWPVYISRTTCK